MKNKTKTTLLIAGIVLVALLLILIAGCLKCGDGICQRGEERKGSCPEDCITSPSNTPVKSIELFIAKGGRVDWYKGSAHELIAYDAISDDILKNTEVYTVEPDGSGKQCVTCDSDIPKGFVGQPAWHPDGEHIIIQVENSNSKHRVMEHVSFGLNNDLWIIKKNGTGAKRIWTTNLNHAALHPHFSHNGTKLIFAERIPTGVKIPGVGDLTPGGENHWDGWQIRIADFNLENMEITKSTTIKPNGNGFYETNEFYNEEEFTFSFTSNGQPYVDDIYSTKFDGTEVVHIINSPTTWEEHGTFSPAGTGDFVFLSSRFDSTWKAPTSKAATVATELFLKKTKGDIVQLTEMNKNAGSNIRYLVSDYDWDKDGKRIVIQIVPINKKSGRSDSPQIWMITFKYPFNVKSINFLENIGGRLDLSKDDVIVFDSKGPDGYYDVYMMNMDGTKRKCLTCDKVQVPQKHNGQPAWHPSGDFIVFQSVDPELKGLPKILSEREKVLTGPGAGVNNNLWLTDKDGERFWQLTEVEDKKGVLHPHFSHDGKKLIWAEIVDQKVKPSGDWVIKIADVIIGENSAKLQNIIVLKPGNMRFFETHGFSADDSKILFSATPDGYYSNLDIYSYDLITKELKQLTGPDSEWDEHAQYSPDGKKIVWMSSKGIPQKIQQYKVKTDYWIMDSNGENKKRITFFNDPQDKSYIEGGVAAADNAWTTDGKRILGYIIVREHQTDRNVLIEFE